MDIYDCVVVINTREALDAFTRLQMTIGGELSAAAGPLGIGGVVESEIRRHPEQAIWTYLKSRGLYIGAQVNGTIILERHDENARFYGKKVHHKGILSGKEVGYPPGTRSLMEVLKSAEGKKDLDIGGMDFST